MKEKILRAFNLTQVTTSDDEGHTLEGYAAVFNSTTNIAGLFNERIDAHAFDECDFSDVCFLVNHDTSRIALARSRRNTPNSTLQLSIDSRGLKTRANLDIENNSEARNLYSAVKRGDVDGMSFMFMVDSDEWSDLNSDMPTRTITKVSKVFEVSAVNFPAYSDTEINARSADALANEKKALENARSAALVNEKNLELEKEKALFEIKLKGGNI